ncbi:MAG: hypothetical protein NXI09_15915 [Bacteroidetes bacterium]|nr:hypothetical protein [Bacteroidota bacterium]
MRKIQEVFVLTVALSLFSSCSWYGETQVVPIARMDTSGVYFKYIIDDSLKEGRFDLDISEQDFSVRDSLIVFIDNFNEERFDFKGIRYGEKDKRDDVVVKLDMKRSYPAMSPRFLEKVPLLKGARSAKDNTSILYDFFREDDKIEQNLIGIFLRINGAGQLFYESSTLEDQILIEKVKDKISKIPPAEPALYKGDTVSTILLFEIPIYY